MKRTTGVLLSGTAVLAATVVVAVTNPIAHAGENAKAGDTLRTSLGDDFAGTWIDRTGKVTVAVTDEDRADLVRDAGAVPKVVRYGKNELDQIQDVLDTRRAPATVHRWFVDPKTNSVVVEVQEGASDPATRAWVDRATESPAVRVVEKTKAPQARVDIFGGNQWNAVGPTFCSVGFTATDAGGGKHFITAAHCATTADNDVVTDNDGNQLGTYDSATDVLGDGGDFAKVDVDADDELVGSVALFNGNAQPIKGSTEAEIGAQVCRSGAASGPDFGAQCGVVTEKNVTVNVNFNRFGTVAVGGQTGTDICSIGGDSGGAFFSGDQAQGVLSSGTGTCGEGGTFTTHFTPVNTILAALDLSLVTS